MDLEKNWKDWFISVYFDWMHKQNIKKEANNMLYVNIN